MKRSPLHQRTGTGGFQMQRNHLRPACRCEWRVGSENRLSPNWFRNRLSPNSFQKTTKSKLPALTRADPPPAAYRWKESGSFFLCCFCPTAGGLADPVLLSPFLSGCPFSRFSTYNTLSFSPCFACCCRTLATTLPNCNASPPLCHFVVSLGHHHHQHQHLRPCEMPV